MNLPARLGGVATIAAWLATCYARTWPPGGPYPTIDAGAVVDDAGTGGAASSSTGPAPCSAICGNMLVAAQPPPLSQLCFPSLQRYDALVACACFGPCAGACNPGNPPPAGDCVAAWKGNALPACKSCRVTVGGCVTEFDDCINDVGDPFDAGPLDASGPCACDPLLPLCPGGDAKCPNGEGPTVCAPASACEPCCDPANACKTAGLCGLTFVAGDPCTFGWECCSGSCINGHCAVPDASGGNCGVVLSTGAGP